VLVVRGLEVEAQKRHFVVLLGGRVVAAQTSLPV
jgi:hypothetical protein